MTCHKSGVHHSALPVPTGHLQPALYESQNGNSPSNQHMLLKRCSEKAAHPPLSLQPYECISFVRVRLFGRGGTLAISVLDVHVGVSSYGYPLRAWTRVPNASIGAVDRYEGSQNVNKRPFSAN